jgi:proteasome lid subunit RPN8/RPN11
MSEAQGYDNAVLLAAIAEGERCYPVEGCGLIFTGPAGRRAVAMENVIDRYHARDPVQFPRTARTGYFMEPRQQLTAIEAAEANGERLSAVFHSHADVGAYFSAEDRAMALTDEGEPLQPGVEYLVLSVRAGRCDGIKGFRFESGGKTFERELPLPTFAP